MFGQKTHKFKKKFNRKPIEKRGPASPGTTGWGRQGQGGEGPYMGRARPGPGRTRGGTRPGRGGGEETAGTGRGEKGKKATNYTDHPIAQLYSHPGS